MECKTFTVETNFCVGKKSRLPSYSNDHSDDVNHPTEVPKRNLTVSEEQLHFFFLSCLLCWFSVEMQQTWVRPNSERKLFSWFPPQHFFFFFLIREKKITVRSFYFCSIKGNEAQKVSCNKDLRKNSLKSGYCLQRYLQKTGSSSVWHLVLFGKTKREAGCSTALFS